MERGVVYVISDLHLGGEPGGAGRSSFQMNEHADHLASFVDWVRRGVGRRDVELVINGDFVDFLAEENPAPNGRGGPWRPFTTEPEQACRTLQRIADKRAPRVFEALRALRRDGGHLTVTLGNHDLELCMPRVEGCLHELLGGQGGKGRLNLILDGRAYSLGGSVRSVLIEHGNFYDPWNTIPLDQVALLRWAHSRGNEGQGLNPPPGSELVANVMNELKRTHRFVDLLHPDQQLVVPLLLVLHPELIRDFARHAKLLSAWIRKSVTIPILPGSRAHKLVSGEGEGDEAVDVRDHFKKALAHLPVDYRDELLESLGADRRAQLVSGGDQVLPQALSDKQVERLAYVLKKAADACKNLFAHDVEGLDDVRRGVEQLRTRFDYVVLGHTHYAKVDPRLGYLNTGTWASVLGVPAWVAGLKGEKAQRFARRFFDYVVRNDFGDRNLFRPTYGRLTLSERETTAELLCYSGEHYPENPAPVGAPWPDVEGLREIDFGPEVE